MNLVSEPVECLIPSPLILHHVASPQIKQTTKATVAISRKMYPFSTFTASFAKDWLKWLCSLSVSDGFWLQGLTTSCTHEHETQWLAQQEYQATDEHSTTISAPSSLYYLRIWKVAECGCDVQLLIHTTVQHLLKLIWHPRAVLSHHICKK